MDTHETHAPVWSRPEHDGEAEPVIMTEEDVVVIESHDATDEPGDTPYETPAHAAARDETYPDDETDADDAVPPEPVSESAVPGSAVPESVVPESVVPESVVPESVVPESVVPESVAAESDVPESVAPGLASEDMAAAPAAEAATATTAVGETTADSKRWSEIKAMFVDDPGESVKLASGLVERAIDDLVTSLRERQGSLASWEEGDASDTEGLRNVLRSYRSLFEQLEGMSGQFGSGKATVTG